MQLSSAGSAYHCTKDIFFVSERPWLSVQCKVQIIYTANEEVARGLYNPAYKLLQMLPGRRSQGQVCIQKFHSIMQDLLQEVTGIYSYCFSLVQTAVNTTINTCYD